MPSSGSEFDLESGLNCLNNNLQVAIEEIAPLKTVTPRQTKRPWIDSDIQHLIHKCNAVHAHYKRIEFLDLRQEIEKRSEDAHSSFLREQISVALDDRIFGGSYDTLDCCPIPRKLYTVSVQMN